MKEKVLILPWATNRLETLLVSVIAQRPGVSAEQLQKQVAEGLRPCSIQAVFQSLKKLRDVGVVLKYGRGYSLSLTWSLELIEFATMLREQYVSEAAAEAIVPRSNQKHVWQFSNLQIAHDFWIQTLVAMFQTSPDPILFSWLPHPWFYFLQTAKAERLYTLIRNQERWIYSIIGGDTYLDKLFARNMDPRCYVASMAAGPFQQEQSAYLGVIGEFVLEIRLDLKTTKRIDKLFTSIKSAAEFARMELITALSESARVRITLAHQPIRAAKLSRTFERYFGVRQKDIAFRAKR